MMRYLKIFILILLCLVITKYSTAFFTNQSADIVIGQPDLNTSENNYGGAGNGGRGLYGPVEIDSLGSQLFVTDHYNHRILVYPNLPLSNYPVASIAIGQSSLWASSTMAIPLGEDTLKKPGQIYCDENRLIVADMENNRVLIYNSMPLEMGEEADIVIGQVDFTSVAENQGMSVGANTLYYPSGVDSDGTRLFIADSRNNRVLIFDQIPTTHNASADIVIGQVDMISTTAYTFGFNGKTLLGPYGIEYHDNKLIITDSIAHRVLIYKQVPSFDFAEADVVIGQPDMFQYGENQGLGTQICNEKSLYLPGGVSCDGSRLFIADAKNNRVLIFNQIPEENNVAADIVIGQKNMTSRDVNQNENVQANTLNLPGDAELIDGKLYVADGLNNRVLIFSDTTPTPTATVTLTATITSTQQPPRFPDGCYAVPNPFTPLGAGAQPYTEIQFYSGHIGSTYTIQIFNIRGKLVRILDNERRWDGKSSDGKYCMGGIYIYQVEVFGKRVSGKVVLIK